MATKLVQNTSTQKTKKVIHNYWKKEVALKPLILTIICVVTKDYSLLKLQASLEHNDFLANLQQKKNSHSIN